MNYEILRLNLTFPDWKNWYGGNVFVAEREVPSPAINVGEDYASGESFGLYVDDDELAWRSGFAEKISQKRATGCISTAFIRILLIICMSLS